MNLALVFFSDLCSVVRPWQSLTALNNGRYMSPMTTLALLALGLGLQFVFLGFLFFDTHAHFQEQYRTAIFSCGAGLLGACIIAVLAVLRRDVVLLAGEILAVCTCVILLYWTMKREE